MKNLEDYTIEELQQALAKKNKEWRTAEDKRLQEMADTFGEVTPEKFMNLPFKDREGAMYDFLEPFCGSYSNKGLRISAGTYNNQTLQPAIEICIYEKTKKKDLKNALLEFIPHIVASEHEQEVVPDSDKLQLISISNPGSEYGGVYDIYRNPQTDKMYLVNTRWHLPSLTETFDDLDDVIDYCFKYFKHKY